jgi:hypothetical protein
MRKVFRMDMSGNPNATWVYHAAAEAQALTLRQQLRGMMTYTSPREVHKTLIELLREDYEYLRTVFAAPAPAAARAAATPSAQPAQPAQPAVDETTGLPKLKADAKIKVVKKGQGIKLDETIDPPAPQPQQPQPQQQEQPQPPLALFPDNGMTPKERKEHFAKINAEAAEKTLARLRAEGVDPKSLLTRENLTDWVERKGLAFTQISRDYVGLPDSVIAESAKKFGLESAVSKNRRKAILANQHKKH